MIQQLSSLSDWLPISFIPTASQLLEKEVVKKMALTPNSIRISGPSLWRVGTGNNFKGFRLVIPCSLDEEPDGETSVSSDNTAVRSVRLPQLILQPGGQLTGRDAVTTNPNPAAPGGGINCDQPGKTVLRRSSRTGQGAATPPAPSPASGPPAPSPLAAAARDSTRASCTRAPSKQKQRRRDGRGWRARGRERALATAARPPRPRASARPGAGGQRAPPCLPPGSGPAPETVSRERARECAPTRGGGLRGR